MYVELDGKARALYNQMEKELFVWLFETQRRRGGEPSSLAVKVNKLLQIASGFIFDEAGVLHELHRAKVDALESIVEEANGAPVLVSQQLRARQGAAHEALPPRALPRRQPQTIVDWNAGRIQMLIAHPASAGHGSNLQDGGNILARFGFDWNLENYMQIIERIGTRMRQMQAGHPRPVYDYPIVAKGTFDGVVLDRLEGKLERAGGAAEGAGAEVYGMSNQQFWDDYDVEKCCAS